MNLDDRILSLDKYYKIEKDVDVTERMDFGQNGQCRYCGKTDQETSFSKKAHAFPELIGNKFIFSKDECNECNEWFSENLENYFANFLGISRTLSQIKAKKGVPKYKTNAGHSRIELGKNGLEIKEREDDTITELDKKNKTLTVSAIKKPYTPDAVFKCLVKMAISIMPNSELTKFKDTIAWIRHGKFPQHHNKEAMQCIYTFIPGPNPLPFIKATLLKRRSISSPVPYMIFMVAFNNYVFQIAIPFARKDKCKAGDQLKMVAIPNPFDGYSDYGKPKIQIIDLSSSELVTEKTDVVNLSFREIKEKSVKSTT